MANEIQALLDETNALDLFQSGFRPCHGTEMALVALLDDLLREADGAKCPCWFSLISQPTLIPLTTV